MGPRTSRSLVAVGLALVVVLAGCAGSTPYEESPDPETAQQRHTEALRDAGSYTYRTTVRANTSVLNLDVATNTTAMVELDPPAQRVNATSGDSEVSLYAPAEAQAYRRVRAGNTVRYERVAPEAVPDVNRTLRPGVANLTRAYEFTANGTATVDGETTYVYEANATTLNQSTAGPLAEVLADADEVTTTVRLYIRADGLVKRISYRAELAVGDATVVLTYRITYTDVGTTSVEEPSWVEEAEEATG